VRLFVALYPDAATQAWIAVSQQQLRENLKGFKRELRWVDPEAVHVTLSFLGEMPESAPIEQALQACHAAPMELPVGGLGVFPSPRRPAVLWTGVADVTHTLARFQAQIAQVLTPFVEPEHRRFEPHLTLARIKPAWHSRLGDALLSLSERWGGAPDPWRVDRFFLMESQLGSAGARHSVVREYRFSTELGA